LIGPELLLRPVGVGTSEDDVAEGVLEKIDDRLERYERGPLAGEGNDEVLEVEQQGYLAFILTCADGTPP